VASEWILHAAGFKFCLTVWNGTKTYHYAGGSAEHFLSHQYASLCLEGK
jgi:hypothetical protein